MSDPTFTDPPTPPGDLDAPATYSSRAAASVAHMATLKAELDVFVPWARGITTTIAGYLTTASATALEILGYKSATEAAQLAAENARDDAIAVSDAPLWVSGTTYAIGDAVLSPITFRTYRDMVGGSSTTDPSADLSRWKVIEFDQLTGAETTLAIAPTAFWSGVLPHMPLSEQVTKSWYNEPLGTATRGTRRDRPTRVSVAGEASSVTIYDLDSGTPEMWRVFPQVSGNWTPIGFHVDASISSVAFDGSRLLVGVRGGGNGRNGLSIIDFGADHVEFLRTGTKKVIGPVASDPQLDADVPSVVTGGLVEPNVNAIATYTAPNAPLNEAGLPISVVPVGTDGGLSVILEDGSVNNSLSTEAVSNVKADDIGVYWTNDGGTKLFFANWDDVRAGDGFGDQRGATTAGNQAVDLLTRLNGRLEVSNSKITALGLSDTGNAVTGVSRYWINHSDPTKSLSQLQTPDFSTTVQFGRPALTALCEADDTDLAASDTLVDRSTSGNDHTLSDAVTIAPVSTGSSANWHTFVAQETIALGSDISATGHISWWEEVSGVATHYLKDLTGGSDYVNGEPGTVSTTLTVSGTNLVVAASKPVSLASVGDGVPTAEQIRLVYLAERPLFFSDGANSVLPEAALDIDIDEVTGLYHMIGATKVWAMDGNGILADSTLADKADLAHDRIDVHEGEVSTWEYAG